MEEKKADNFWLYIGGIIALAIVLVIVFKSREVESLHTDSYNQLMQENVKQIQQNQ